MPLWILLLLIYFGTAGILIGALWSFVGYRGFRNVRRPVKEKMLRPPGWSVQERMDALGEKLFVVLLVAVLLPILTAAVSAGGGFGTVVPSAKVKLALIGSAIIVLPLAASCVPLMRRYGNYRLGFKGEQLVAEQLQELVRLGCYVYHDIQPDKTWNVDHIVVAPESVLVIETKTRRKRDGGESNAAHEVIFDGKVIHFPTFSDTHGLKQAERNANWVRDYLSKALHEPVTVEPVLVLP